MKHTDNELIDEQLIPKIQKIFSDLYGGDPRNDLHENLIQVVDVENCVFRLDFEEIDRLRAWAMRSGGYPIYDALCQLMHEIIETTKYFLADYPHITIENVY